MLGRPVEALEHLAPISEATCTAAAAAGAWPSSRKPPTYSLSPPVPATSTAAVASASAAASAAPTTAGGGVSGLSLPGGILGGGDGKGLYPEVAAEARASLHANLAVVHALQDNLAQAERCARAAMGICPGSAAVLRVAVYVLIRQGNVAEALQVCEPIYSEKGQNI